MVPIPFDVLMEILPFIDSPDLTRMARANKDLSGYALDRMYAHIRCRSMQSACGSIASNPSLARRVRCLEINRENNGTDIESFLPALRDILPMTVNLRTLVLDIEGNHSWVLTPALGAFKLRSFSCCTFTDQHLLDFLQDQTEVEEISLAHSFIPYGRSVPWKFPKLRKLSGPMTWVDTILPHNPVSHVVISHISTTAAITSLGLTNTPIRRLEIPFQALRPNPVNELKVLFPALDDITLTIPFDWTTRNSPTQDLSGWLQDLFAALSSVKQVSLFSYRLGDTWLQDEPYFVKRVTERAPGVRTFYLQYRDTRTSTGKRVVCWTRGINGWESAQI
ncbi:hypothetical protein DFH09DRAFT_585590 [Mycena vulgaris]|nr:hypothetical protein DFH09DRAFT_585590 [Mycena vulgaris]